MELSFIPIDYDYFDFQGENYIKIIGRTKDGKRVCLIDNCDVYFYAILKENLSESKINQIIEKIKRIQLKEGARLSKVIKVELKDKNFLGEKVNALKIYISNHKDAKKISESLPHKYFKHIRELDVNYITRYIIEKKLFPLIWHKISGEVLNNSEEFGGIDSVLEVDFCIKIEKIEKSKEQPEFKPKVMAFDIETESFEIGQGEISMISLYDEKIKKVLTHKKINSKEKYIEYYDDEADMLEAFVKIVKKESPDILTGYFSDGFDLPYIKARAEKNRVKLSLGLDGSQLKFSGGMSPRGKIFGIVHVDLFKFIQTAYSQYLESETLGLNDVANELIGEKKSDYEFKPNEKMSEIDWKKFIEYNLQDSIITQKLFLKVWPDMIEFSKIIQEPLFHVSRDGMSSNVDNFIIHNLEKYNEIIEKKPIHDEIGKRRSEGKYEGAFVLEPKPGLYENVVMFDFTSMYASVIITYNLSKSTFLEKKEKNNIEVNLGNVKAYFTKKKGFFPEILEEIINLRKKYKKEYQQSPSPILKARSNAFKLIANAAYGYQGFFGARYYQREAAASTAALARENILEVIKKIKSYGYEIIYSDTDSIAFSQGKKSKKEILKMLDEINNNLPGIMELELEDFYKRGIWVTTRSGEVGAKKKYALINEKNKMKIRGFETVRRDWCNVARELQNKVLEKILSEGNEKSALEYTKKIIIQIEKREIEKEKLIIKTQLKKPLSEYKANTPHVTIAKKMLSLGIPVDPGILIKYYIAESDKKKSLARDRAKLPEEKTPYDIEYYLKKQVIPAVENIFHVFGIKLEDIIKGSKQQTLF